MLPFEIQTFIFFLLFSFSITHTCTTQQSTPYFSAINKAELAICHSNNQAALQHYEQAFQYDTQLFAKDLYNALLCAAQTSTFDMLDFCYQNLLSKGISRSKLDTIRAFKIHKKQWQIITQKYVDLAPSCDQTYRQELDQLLSLDQKIRKYCAQKAGYIYAPSCIDTIQFVDSLNLLHLKLLFQNKGIATEDKVGIQKILDNNPYDLLIRHHLAHYSETDILDDLKRAVQEGDLHPVFYAFWKDNWLSTHHLETKFEREHFGTQNALVIADSIYLFIDSEEDIINQRRAQLKMCSMNDFRIKLQFQLQHPEFLFIHGCLLPKIRADQAMINQIITQAKNQNDQVLIISKNPKK